MHPHPATLSGVFYADAATFGIAAACVVQLNVRATLTTEPFRVADLVKDRAFLTASLSQAALSLHSTLLTVALPLWISTRTSVPVSLYGLVLSGSTILAVLLQLPVSRRIKTNAAIRRAAWGSGALVGVMCLLLAPPAPRRRGWPAY